MGALSASQRVEIVRGSGVDIDEYPLTELPAGPVRFLFMGRLLRDKGIYEYVEAARAVRARRADVVFSVLGGLDANPTSVTQRQLDMWRHEGVIEYLGATTDVRPFLAATHVLVLPSYREGTPRSVLEAMSMGRAVITTDAPGSRETVVDGQSGRLVPPRNAAAIAAAATSLIEDRALLRKLALEARARAVHLYDGRKVAAGMLDVLGL
jgi:glycosyltransferase involved in cell wall biosynthesis